MYFSKEKKGENMEEKIFLTAIEVAETLGGISKSAAYRIIKKLNNDLEEKGKIILPGKINKKYFEEKINY